MAASGATGSPATITITCTVAPQPPALSLSFSPLSFSGTVGGVTAPAWSAINVSNAGGGTLGFTAVTDSPWLVVTPDSGTAPQALQVSAAVGALGVGSYTGNVIITSAGAQGSQQYGTG